MNELSLFSGAGGGLLTTKHLLGWKTIGYVEIDQYCQAVLAQRIEDEYLDPAPIFGDIRKFISEGYAEAYKGMVDVITAGFPCQPFSVAGKQKGEQDERNLWPATAETISIIKPQFVLLENVQGIRRYLPVVYRDLRRIGYEVQQPLLLGADDIGAMDARKRVWIMAHPTCTRLAERRDIQAKVHQKDETPKENKSAIRFTDLVDCNIFSTARNWPRESMFLRKYHGVAYRVDRIKAIGEGQVPRVVEVAWEVLNKCP